MLPESTTSPRQGAPMPEAQVLARRAGFLEENRVGPLARALLAILEARRHGRRPGRVRYVVSPVEMLSAHLVIEADAIRSALEELAAVRAIRLASAGEVSLAFPLEFDGQRYREPPSLRDPATPLYVLGSGRSVRLGDLEPWADE